MKQFETTVDQTFHEQALLWYAGQDQMVSLKYIPNINKGGKMMKAWFENKKKEFEALPEDQNYQWRSRRHGSKI